MNFKKNFNYKIINNYLILDSKAKLLLFIKF